MSVVLTIAQTQSSAQAIGRRVLSTLCEVWTAHTLKRAIADVAPMSEEDYRDFGLDKGEMLAELTSLRDEIKGRATMPGSTLLSSRLQRLPTGDRCGKAQAWISCLRA